MTNDDQEKRVPVFIGLGSNLAQPAYQLGLAVTALKAIPDSVYRADSGIFRSRPMLSPDNDEVQPDYLNAVALLETALSPDELLECCQLIENKQGRTRLKRWEPRVIDLDILLYGQIILAKPHLTIPHPGIGQREFVLYPLQRLCKKLGATELIIPGHGKLTEIVAACPDNAIKFVGEIE